MRKEEAMCIQDKRGTHRCLPVARNRSALLLPALKLKQETWAKPSAPWQMVLSSRPRRPNEPGGAGAWYGETAPSQALISPRRVVQLSSILFLSPALCANAVNVVTSSKQSQINSHIHFSLGTIAVSHTLARAQAVKYECQFFLKKVFIQNHTSLQNIVIILFVISWLLKYGKNILKLQKLVVSKI